MARPQPPPYAQLIAARRVAPPKMPVTEAARRAGISDTRWSQLENGYRLTRGRAQPEHAPAGTLALMARAVGVTPAELEEAGRADAAAELAALPPPEPRESVEEMFRRYVALAEESNERMRRLEDKVDRLSEPGAESSDEEEERRGRRAV